jgi:hypothetical protein
MRFRLFILLLFALAASACAPVAQSTPAPTAAVQVAADAQAGAPATGEFLPPSFPPSSLLNSEWITQFDQRIVEWDEIRSGGPPKDGIPAIDDPTYESVEAARAWLSDRDPVIAFEHGGEVRAYPLAILIWHEIVNDTVGGLPVSVTFCPLCNASIVFSREFAGQTLDFGTTGLLRNSDLIMYDRQSETWWQQALGLAIVGDYAGQRLTFLPAQVVSFADYAAVYPQGDLLARPGAGRSYGNNPYAGYDSTGGRPFLFDGELDTRLGATVRVVGVQIDEAVRAYPFPVVAAAGAINDELAGMPIVVLHKAGTASALDERTISQGRDVGSSAVFDRQVGAQTLTFSGNDDGTFTDAETGSSWNILGQATAGPLAGEQLTRLVAFDHFWFAWAAFFPTTEIYGE